jgi:polyisoprenoid-binding protein YceI
MFRSSRTHLAACAVFLAALLGACKNNQDARASASAAETSPTEPPAAPASSEPAAVTRFGEHAGTYEVDGSHSTVLFRVMHLGVAPVYGRFNQVSGTLNLADDPAASRIALSIATDSIFTAEKKRDTHLKSPDFFDAKQYPTVRFESTDIKPAGERRYQVGGKLDLHGTSRPVTAEVEFTGAGADPWGGQRTGFEGRLRFKRSDFGMNFMLDGLSDEIDVIIALEAIKK